MVIKESQDVLFFNQNSNPKFDIIDPKTTPVIGIRLRFGIMYFLGQSIFPWKH